MSNSNVTLYLNRPRRILLYLGVWLPPASYSFLYLIYKIFIMILEYSFLLFEFIYIADVWGDLDAVSEASFLLFTQASVCYKVTKFIVSKNSFILLIQLMGEDIFEPRNKEHERFLATQLRTIKRLCLFFLTSALTTVTLWGVIPVAESAGDERFFPFRIWMPVGPSQSPHYELGYLYQMVTIYISALLFNGVDSVALTMIMFGCAQLEIIMDKAKQMQVVPLFGRLKQEERDRRIRDNYALFIDCIKHHQAVIRFIETVEDTYHANIFFQLCGSVAIICIIGLRISIAKPGSVQFISMLSYMVTMLAQLFMYCWCGNELTIRSELLREVMYLSPWYEQSNSFRRLLCFAMERMKRPLIFKAGHYIPLSRPTFVSILRSSYSYFAVLNQAKNKEK